MPDDSPLVAAIDRALAIVRRAGAAGLARQDGQPATAELAALGAGLRTARDAATTAGHVDPEWITAAVRTAAAWLPESEVAVLAALGAIARANRAAIVGLR